MNGHGAGVCVGAGGLERAVDVGLGVWGVGGLRGCGVGGGFGWSCRCGLLLLGGALIAILQRIVQRIVQCRCNGV